jgi:hypothetical protein
VEQVGVEPTIPACPCSASPCSHSVNFVNNSKFEGRNVSRCPIFFICHYLSSLCSQSDLNRQPRRLECPALPLSYGSLCIYYSTSFYSCQMFFAMYSWWDSNPQSLRQLILSQPCMPIPPQKHNVLALL